jgi:hypothetical protein
MPISFHPNAASAHACITADAQHVRHNNHRPLVWGPKRVLQC